MGQKHIHADLIKAWADGAEVEYLCDENEWVAIDDPEWMFNRRYRIKPQPKPDFGIVAIVSISHFRQLNVSPVWAGNIDSNVRFIFDAETEKLKAVELIK